MRPLCHAKAASSTRIRAPILSCRLERGVFTVPSEMMSFLAISALLRARRSPKHFLLPVGQRCRELNMLGRRRCGAGVGEKADCDRRRCQNVTTMRSSRRFEQQRGTSIPT